MIKWIATLHYHYLTLSLTSQQAAATHCWELSSISSLDTHMIILRSSEGQRAKRLTRDRDVKKT